MTNKKISSLNPFTIIFIFIAAVTIIILIIFQVKKVNFSNIFKFETPRIVISNDSFLKLPNSVGGQYSQKFNEGEVCGLINDYLSDYINEPTCTFTNNLMILEGKAKFAFGNTVNISVTPKNDGGALHLDFSNGKAGVVPIPDFIMTGVKNTANSLLDNNFNKYTKTINTSFTNNIFNIEYELRGENK